MTDSVYSEQKNDIELNVSDLKFDTVNAVNSFTDEIDALNNNAKNSDILIDILNSELTLNNFEDVFCLNKYQAIELQPDSDEQIRNIRYKDFDGITVALVQIDSKNNKIKVETFSNIFPKQDFCNPQEVSKRVRKKALIECWKTEDGGINQFDGNIEVRYKDNDGLVMAALITKADGYKADTVVEYQYIDGKKSQMLHTNQFGQSITIYDTKNDTVKLMCVDIDTDGYIYNVTKGFTTQLS